MEFLRLNRFIHVALEFAYRGYPTRDNFVGKLVHTKKHVFGPALSQVYQIENEFAQFPNKTRNADIFEIAKSSPLRINSSDYEMESVMNCLAQ